MSDGVQRWRCSVWAVSHGCAVHAIAACIEWPHGVMVTAHGARLSDSMPDGKKR
jgi:hypothetical protein